LVAPTANHSLGCTAVASDEHDMLVALVHAAKTLHQLLDRLEQPLSPAIDHHRERRIGRPRLSCVL
jgi:hypothetical protein